MNTDGPEPGGKQDASAASPLPPPGAPPVLRAPTLRAPTSRLMRRFAWLALTISVLGYALYAPLLNRARAAEVRRSEEAVAAAAPAQALTRTDGEILLCWCYVPVKLGRLVQNCALDGEAGSACGDVSSPRSIAERLPTSPKYRPMTDSTLALVRQREEVVRAAKQERCLPVEAVQAARSMEPFAGEIRFVTGKADPHWKDEVLGQHFGSF